LIRRLERELGTPLFSRTTRRVALTGAWAEPPARSKTIFDDIAAATAAVSRVASGEAGTVRVGITPLAAHVLAPHLRGVFAAQAPQVTVSMQPMWLPALSRAVAAGDIDVAITCGIIPEPAGVVGEIFAAEPLLAGLRPGHRLAGQASVSLAELAQDVLGRPRESLFPAWALSQQQALEQAGVHPDRSTWKTPIWPPLAGSTSPVSALQWNPTVYRPLPSLASSTPRSPLTCHPAG
jgi:DNA-binding transcriptional LysR family regulator